jgi:hypothetical protein
LLRPAFSLQEASAQYGTAGRRQEKACKTWPFPRGRRRRQGLLPLFLPEIHDFSAGSQELARQLL